MTAPEPQPRSALAEKIGRLAALALDAAISHSTSHCCPDDGKTAAGPRPGGQARTPSGQDAPPKYLPEITEFLARPADVRCRPSFTDTVGTVLITYVSPVNGLTLQATPARHIVAGQAYSANAPAFGVAVQPPQVVYGANDVVAQMDHPSGGPERGLYLGSVSGTTSTAGPTRPVIIYVDDVT